MIFTVKGIIMDCLFWHRNCRCTTSYKLINIMDIRSCCVVVAMVTSKSTKCSTWSVRVSSVTLCLPPCMKARTVKFTWLLQLSRLFCLKKFICTSRNSVILNDFHSIIISLASHFTEKWFGVILSKMEFTVDFTAFKSCLAALLYCTSINYKFSINQSDKNTWSILI